MARYHPDRGLVEFILGITFDIWERGRVERIHDYYDADARIYALSGLVRGAGGMIAGTRRMLEAFPDRLLLADDVIWSGSPAEGYHSSHRVLSPMTNTGPSAYGPATGKRVRTLTIADCIVEGGRITREYLLRDHYPLVRQLGVDPRRAAEEMAVERGAETEQWIESEIARLARGGGTARGAQAAQRAAAQGMPAQEMPTQGMPAPGLPAPGLPAPGLPARGMPPSPRADPRGFARRVIESHLGPEGEAAPDAVPDAAYAKYAVMRRSPVEIYSGRDSIKAHYARLRGALSGCRVSIDHVATQPVDLEGLRIAVRWGAAGEHAGDYLGIPATGRPVLVLGSTHWRIVGGRIAMEWTVFDQLGVMAQLV